ncbi:MAG TPA: zf-HC2 domain-containing protein [Armatimonadota bacterium]|jgi:predicted anti-sigma-YlaC factor YlaD
MTCDKATMLLERRWDGALNGEEERALDDHIRDCETCAAEAQAIALADAAFLAIPEEDPPVDITALVRERLAEESPAEPRRLWFWIGAVLVSALAAMTWRSGLSPATWMQIPAVAAVASPITHIVADWLRPVGLACAAVSPALVTLAKWAAAPVALEVIALGLWMARRNSGQIARQS